MEGRIFPMTHKEYLEELKNIKALDEEAKKEGFLNWMDKIEFQAAENKWLQPDDDNFYDDID